MGKVFSSRTEQGSSVEHLQEIVFLLHDTLELDTDPAETTEDLMAQIDSAAVQLSLESEEMRNTMDALAKDLIGLTTSNIVLRHELRGAANLLTRLLDPVTDEHALAAALTVLRREGDPKLDTVTGDDDDEIPFAIELTFTEDMLAEGLRCAIEAYNTAVAS